MCGTCTCTLDMWRALSTGYSNKPQMEPDRGSFLSMLNILAMLTYIPKCWYVPAVSLSSWKPREILWDHMLLVLCNETLLFNLTSGKIWTNLLPAYARCISSNSPEFWSTLVQLLCWDLWAGRFCCLLNNFILFRQQKPNEIIYMWAISFKIHFKVYFSMCPFIMFWKPAYEKDEAVWTKGKDLVAIHIWGNNYIS